MRCAECLSETLCPSIGDRPSISRLVYGWIGNCGSPNSTGCRMFCLLGSQGCLTLFRNESNLPQSNLFLSVCPSSSLLKSSHSKSINTPFTPFFFLTTRDIPPMIFIVESLSQMPCLFLHISLFRRKIIVSFKQNKTCLWKNNQNSRYSLETFSVLPFK